MAWLEAWMTLEIPNSFEDDVNDDDEWVLEVESSLWVETGVTRSYGEPQEKEKSIAYQLCWTRC
jgi:hypothetical protein